MKKKNLPPSIKPTVRKKAKPRPSKMQDEIRAAAPLLKGTVLVIDPSSGSEGSLPGFCLIEQGIITQSGVIAISRTKRAPERLRELALALSANFPPLDVLCIEYIPPFMASAGQGGFRTQGVVNLHRAVGVVMACTQWKTLLQISPQSWHAWERKHIGPNYEKNDENDAIAMALCLMSIAGVKVENEAAILPLLVMPGTSQQKELT